jgi:hypothetical protein
VFLRQLPEVEMTKRPARVLRAGLSGLVACASIAVIPPRVEAAPSDCLLVRPTTAAPAGQYWLHLSEPGKNRSCWVLRAKLETPSQVKMRAGTRATEGTAPNQSPTGAELPPRPGITDDKKGASRTDAPPTVSDRAEQVLPHVENSDSAMLPPPGSRPPETFGAGSAASASLATPALTVQKPATEQHASIDASEPSVAPVAATNGNVRETGAISFLQLLFLATFFGPALYLFAVGAIRRLITAGRPPPAYPSLREPSAPHALLPPRLEPSENAIQS